MYCIFMVIQFTGTLQYLLLFDKCACLSRFGSTPLHQAAYFGHLTCAQVLLQAGAMVNVEEAWGQTPLYLAAQRAHRYKNII